MLLLNRIKRTIHPDARFFSLDKVDVTTRRSFNYYYRPVAMEVQGRIVVEVIYSDELAVYRFEIDSETGLGVAKAMYGEGVSQPVRLQRGVLEGEEYWDLVCGSTSALWGEHLLFQVSPSSGEEFLSWEEDVETFLNSAR